MAETFADFFNELFFGVSGSWLGLILMLIFLIIITASSKYGVVLSLPLSLIMGLLYIDHNLMWQSIMMFAFSIFGLISAAKELK